MSDSDQELKARIEALERTVTALQHEVGALKSARTVPPRRPVSRDGVIVQQAAEARKTIADRVSWSVEGLLIKGGIGLLLLGVALLFYYAIEQGWLTPWIRVAFGLALGTALMVLGLWIRPRRQGFGQVLLGGGVATFYITLFAAYQVLALLPYTVAFGGMAIVTILALGLAAGQDDPVLSVIGALGGLATPFLLYRGEGSLPALMMYTALILTSTSVLYLFKGWRTLLLASVIGGWLVLATAFGGLTAMFSDQLALQLGVGFAVLVFWALPVVRYILHAGNPEAWPQDPLDGWDKRGGSLMTRVFRHPAHQMAITTPLIALAMTEAIWQWPFNFAWIVLAATMLWFAVAAGLNRNEYPRLAYTHALTAALLLTVFLTLLFEGDVLFVSLAAEVLVLLLVARSLSDRILRWGAHVLAVVVGTWLSVRLGGFRVGEATPVFNGNAVANLFATGVFLLGAFVQGRGVMARFYALVGHVMLLWWFSHELGALENGQAYVSIAWGLYAVLLIVFGLLRDVALLRIGGLLTLGLVVVKLFLVDLAELDPLWRILLFLGFGTAFLLLGYLVPGLWRTKPVEEETTTT